MLANTRKCYSPAEIFFAPFVLHNAVRNLRPVLVALVERHKCGCQHFLDDASLFSGGSDAPR
jgi:hypothetical protein